MEQRVMVAGEARRRSGVYKSMWKLGVLSLRREPLGRIRTLESSSRVLKFYTH